MSTETIIKVGGISKEFAGPHFAIGGGTGNSGISGGEDFIEGAGDGITRDIKGL